MNIDLTETCLDKRTQPVMHKSGYIRNLLPAFYRRFNSRVLFMIFFSVLFFSVKASADICFIVHPSVPHEHITKTNIKEIFLGKKLMWEDNQEVKFVLIKQADFHTEFTIRYLNKTPSQFERYWRTILFSGKGLYPENAKSEDDVITFVEKNKGAIGYISSGTRIRNRRVVVVDVQD